MNELTSRGSHIEKFNQKKEKMCASQGRGPHLVFIIDMENFDDGDMLVDPMIDVLTSEILKGKISLDLPIRSDKGKYVISS